MRETASENRSTRQGALINRVDRTDAGVLPDIGKLTEPCVENALISLERLIRHGRTQPH